LTIISPQLSAQYKLKIDEHKF